MGRRLISATARADAAEKKFDQLLNLIEQEAEHWSHEGQWDGPMAPPVPEGTRLMLHKKFSDLVVLAKQIKEGNNG
jgi:hypothetical protein